MSLFYKQCQDILDYCHRAFIEMHEQQLISLPPIWNVNPKKLGLCFHPSIETLLPFVDGDLSKLTALGFQHDLEERLFIPWYKKSNEHFQVYPLSKSGELTNDKITGLNKDLPLFYKKVSYHTKTQKYPVIVTALAVDALLLNSQGHLAVALGSTLLLKGQIHSLAELNTPFVYLGVNNKHDEQAAEKFIATMSKYTEVNVLLVKDNVEKAINAEQVNVNNATHGLVFLAQRIMHKANGKSDYERNIDVLKIANEVGASKRDLFMHYAVKEGAKKYQPFATALRLCADLMDANVPLKKATEIVEERYGVSVYMRNMHHIKINP